MHCFKRLGERVMARTFERQVVELHVRVALLNRFSQLGRPDSVAVAVVAWVRLGLGSCRAQFGLCNKAVRVLHAKGTQKLFRLIVAGGTWCVEGGFVVLCH